MTQLDPATRTYEVGVRDSIKALPKELGPVQVPGFDERLGYYNSAIAEARAIQRGDQVKGG